MIQPFKQVQRVTPKIKMLPKPSRLCSVLQTWRPLPVSILSGEICSTPHNPISSLQRWLSPATTKQNQSSATFRVSDPCRIDFDPNQRRSYAATTKSSLKSFITIFAASRSKIDDAEEIVRGSNLMTPKFSWVREWDLSIRPCRARLKLDLILVGGAHIGSARASLVSGLILTAAGNHGADPGGLKAMGDRWRQVSGPHTSVTGIVALQSISVTGGVVVPIRAVHIRGAKGVRYANETTETSHSMAEAESGFICAVIDPSVSQSNSESAKLKAGIDVATSGGVPKFGWAPRSAVWPKSLGRPNCVRVSNSFWVPKQNWVQKLNPVLKLKVLGSGSMGFRIWDPGGWTQSNLLALTWMARRDFSFLLNSAYVLCSSFFIVIGLLSFVSTDCLMSGASMPRPKLAHRW